MSTAQADAFARRVFEVLSAEATSGRLVAPPETAKVFRSKSYYARHWDSTIIADVSLEMSTSASSHPWLVWIFECQDYADKVPNKDFDDLRSKVEQMGENETKGTLVTMSSLENNGLRAVQSRGLGVIRLLPRDQVEPKGPAAATPEGVAVNVDWSEFRPAMTDPRHRSNRDFFAFDNAYWFATWESLLQHGLSTRRDQPRT